MRRLLAILGITAASAATALSIFAGGASASPGMTHDNPQAAQCRCMTHDNPQV